MTITVKQGIQFTLILLISNFTLACHFLDRFTLRHGPDADAGPGVSFYDASRAQEGVNMVIDNLPRDCRFIDMKGRDIGSLPGEFCLFLPNGQFFTNMPDATLFNADLQIAWSLPQYRIHHDVVYDPERDWIWFLTYEKGQANGKNCLWDRLIAVDRESGRERFRWAPEEHLSELGKVSGDPMEYKFSPAVRENIVTHLNSISVIRPGSLGAGRAGDILLSDAGASGLVYILNPERKRLVWFGKVRNEFNESASQHSAHYRKGGDILMFVNNADFSKRRKSPTENQSYIGLFDSVKEVFAWTYRPLNSQRFFSERFGAVEELENGNFLITYLKLDDQGAAFEITPQGRVVWEWSHELKYANGAPVPVYRVSRLKRGLVEPYLNKWKSFGVSPN